MSDHDPAPSEGAKKSSHGGGKNFVEDFAMGMHELAHKSGLGATLEVPSAIGQLFGAEGGGKQGHGEKHN